MKIKRQQKPAEPNSAQPHTITDAAHCAGGLVMGGGVQHTDAFITIMSVRDMVMVSPDPGHAYQPSSSLVSS